MCYAVLFFFVLWKIRIFFRLLLGILTRVRSFYTDGIGKAMAFEAAKKGLNVLLISRTESKLVAVEAELRAACPSVTVEHLAIDYSNFDTAAQVSTFLLLLLFFVILQQRGKSIA